MKAVNDIPYEGRGTKTDKALGIKTIIDIITIIKKIILFGNFTTNFIF
jgi:hypothetical protein